MKDRWVPEEMAPKWYDYVLMVWDYIKLPIAFIVSIALILWWIRIVEWIGGIG